MLKVAVLLLLGLAYCVAVYDPCTLATDCYTCFEAGKSCFWCDRSKSTNETMGFCTSNTLACSSTTYNILRNSTQCVGSVNCTAPNSVQLGTGNCLTCISDPQTCGWCFVPGTAGQCYGIRFEGDCNYVGNFTTNEADCFNDTYAPECATFTNCSSCLANSHCGYCDSTSPHKCLENNGENICTQVLTGWAGVWYNASCPMNATTAPTTTQNAATTHLQILMGSVLVALVAILF